MSTTYLSSTSGTVRYCPKEIDVGSKFILAAFVAALPMTVFAQETPAAMSDEQLESNAVTAYEEIMKTIGKDVDVEVTTTADVAKAGLGSAPDIDINLLNQISEEERQIRLMNARINKLQVAKELWDLTQQAEGDGVGGGVQSRIDLMEAANSEFLAQYENDRTEMVLKFDELSQQLTDLTMKMEEMPVGGGDMYNQSESFDNQDSGEFVGDPNSPPEIVSVAGSGNKLTATLIDGMNRRFEVKVGDIVPRTGMRVTSITTTSVDVDSGDGAKGSLNFR
jgi:type IV pilus biogenesis protein PilP